MWPLSMPIDQVQETYRTCIAGVEDDDLRARLGHSEQFVIAATSQFEAATRDVRLHELDRSLFGPASPSEQKELQNVYTNRLAKKGSTARHIYDRIKLATSQCPLCGHRDVETLDHHLPKAYYSYLSVTPSNLIPACSDCNHIKTATSPLVADQETLHPYFDNIDDDVWLSAIIDEEAYPLVNFFVLPPPHWSAILSMRVCYHFRVFGLKSLYAKQAINQLAGVRHEVDWIFKHEGSAGVREHLELRAESWASHRRNYWTTALFRSLAGSEWYCAGGFASG